MKEKEIIRQIMIAAPYYGARLFRNNVGVADYGGKRVAYGLAKGSPDLVGWRTIDIEQQHVGQKIAVFFAVEIKTAKTRETQNQKNFIAAVHNAGGIAKIHYENQPIEQLFVLP